MERAHKYIVRGHGQRLCHNFCPQVLKMELKCQILLKSTKDGVFKSGEPVTGTLKYSIDAPTVLESINIYLKGKLKGKSSFLESDHHEMICKEVFVSLHTNILQKENKKEGIYEHSFEFLLPKEVPSSFRDKMCTISYKVIAEFAGPGSFNSIKQFETEIPVYGHVKPYSGQPLMYGLTKSPFPLHKPIDLDIEIEKNFFTAGENIKLKYFIINETNIPVIGVKTKLISETTYKYDDKHKKYQRRTIGQSEIESNIVNTSGETQLTCIVATLPNLYSIQHSKHFSREYKIIVTASFPFPHRDASVEIPVVIAKGNNVYNIN